MRERLDCAMLDFGAIQDWGKQKNGSYARGRLHLHLVQQPGLDVGNVHVLAHMAAHLQRFDVCMLAVGQENLAWVRQIMLAAQSRLRTPLIGLVRNLKAPAINDLYNLGMADFVREPLCVEEIRIRTERLLDNPRSIRVPTYADIATSSCAVHDGRKCYRSCDVCCDATALGVSPELTDVGQAAVLGSAASSQAGDIALEAFAVAAASQCAASSESFGVAKGRVIQCFERTYIHASLAKSSGNIAQAARGAKKHRRAFWALMRKHDIDAAPYRNVMPPNQ